MISYNLLVPRKAINHLWQVFNDIADGFGIGVDEYVLDCPVAVSVTTISYGGNPPVILISTSPEPSYCTLSSSINQL